MPAGLAWWRGRQGSRLRLTPVRGLTLTGGVALGGVILLGLALLGGLGGLGPVGEPPVLEAEVGAERLGPRTAVQPELYRALLTDQDLTDAHPTTSPTDHAAPAGGTAPVATPPAPAPPDQDEAAPADPERCRAMFEDPAGLPALWPATPPRQTTSRHTTRRGGAVLRQVLSVFEDDHARAAFGQLRETAAECNEFPATLDGEPVVVVLRDLAPGPAGRPESATTGEALSDESYAMEITIHREAGTLIGWLALDRLGPVVSLLRRLGPEDAPADDPAQTRTSAIGKLRPVLRLLDR